MKLVWALGAATLALGCGSASLADLPNRGILVAQGASARDPSEVLVQLDSGRDDGFCWTLNDDVEATFNGRAMKVIERGGPPNWYSDGCYPPQLSIQMDPSDAELGEAEIVVKDRATTMRARFAQYFTPRSVQVVDPANLSVVRGQTVTLAWEPSSHRMTVYCDGSGCDPVVAFAYGTASTVEWQITDATALSTTDNRITVRIPETARAGDGELIIASRYALMPQVLECDNAALCEAYWLNEVLSTPLTIALP